MERAEAAQRACCQHWAQQALKENTKGGQSALMGPWTGQEGKAGYLQASPASDSAENTEETHSSTSIQEA